VTFYQSVGMNVVTALPHLSTEVEMMLINLGVDRQRARSVMENQLSSALRRIVVLTQKMDHIPPITTNEANPFPYQVFILRKLYVLKWKIIIPAAQSQMGMEGEGWGAVLKKTLFDATTGPS
jgi:hypothetical protein